MKKTAQISHTQRTLNVWAIILILWSLYRTTFKTELPVWFDEIFAKPVIFLLPIHYFITRYEKKNLLERLDIFLDRKNDLVIGFAIGLVFFLCIGLISYLRENQGFAVEPTLGMLLYIVIVSMFTGFTEEILARGFVLKRLFEESKNALSAVFIGSILFFITHIPIIFSNPKYYGTSLVVILISDLLFSFFVSFIYLARKNVLVPILIHVFYILTLYLFFSPIG